MHLAILAAVRNIIFAALGERVLAKVLFGIAKYLSARTETDIDDAIVAEWEDTYYGKRSDKG